MKPGRELDAIIAEKVMGFELIRTNLYQRKYWIYALDLKEEDSINNPNSPLEIPYYSTDIKHAWEIVEHLISKSLYQNIIKPEFELIQIDTGWNCTFNKTRINFCYAQTAALAICIAALEFKEFKSKFYVEVIDDV